MTTSLQNKPIIITGAASGIGRATAKLLHKHGAKLSLWDVQTAELTTFGLELNAHTLVVDVTNADSVAQAMQDAFTHIGPPAAVIHSAGILRTGLFNDIPLTQQQKIIEVNLTGSLNIAYHTLPHLRQTAGSLIFLASTSALYGPPEYASYGASKAGVLSLAQALRVENEKAGVHIAAVIPSFVDTPMNTAHNPDIKLYERFGVAHSAEDVAQAILTQGLQKRRFHIWPNIQPRLLYILALFTNPFGHLLMRLFWR